MASSVFDLSLLDRVFRTFIMRTRFFKEGWGSAEDMRRILELRRFAFSSRENCSTLIARNHAIHIDKVTTSGAFKTMSGHFRSPLVDLLPDLMPKATERAHFEIVLPAERPNELPPAYRKDGREELYDKARQPMCLQLAGTGDHFFWRRRNLIAKPLIRESAIGSILLENPFYGLRKPPEQWRSSLHRVTDLFVMGVALIAESAALLDWCEREGFGPLGITGFSMGGHMASLAASAWPSPLAIIPCLCASTASAVFTEGVMSQACVWPALSEQIAQIESAVLPFSTLTSSSDTQTAASIAKAGAVAMGATSETIEAINNASKQKIASDESAVRMMKKFMDEATHLCNFFVPVTTDATIIVVARHDAYIPLTYAEELSKLWPGSQVRYTDGGHVTSFLLKQNVFKQAIVDAFMQSHRMKR